MVKNDFKCVDEYIASQPEDAQVALKRVRSAIRKAAPEAEEVISYKMPTYKLQGEPLVSLAAWKNHYSLYAATASVEAAFKKELVPYEVIKGTIRFPLDGPVPAHLIARIVTFRLKEVKKRLAAKAPKP
jgi:uncharacterized protein YdhG (YjbR/CyaY superfamily)